MKKFLEFHVNRVAYSPGRPSEDAAFIDGQRALALTMLSLGGQIDQYLTDGEINE